MEFPCLLQLFIPVAKYYFYQCLVAGRYRVGISATDAWFRPHMTSFMWSFAVYNYGEGGGGAEPAVVLNMPCGVLVVALNTPFMVTIEVGF